MKSKIEELVKFELHRADNKHGALLHSAHEAYAVLKEEIEELGESVEITESNMKFLWGFVKEDKPELFKIPLNRIRAEAFNAVLEAIQVVAMVDKFEREIVQEEKK